MLANSFKGEPRPHEQVKDGILWKNTLAGDFPLAASKMESAIEQTFGIFSFEQNGYDYMEKALVKRT